MPNPFYPTTHSRLYWWWMAWKPYLIHYRFHGPSSPWVLGISWRRWALYFYPKPIYPGHKGKFGWCNYYGTGEGG